MIRFYLVPVIGNGLTVKDGWRPKYFTDMTKTKYHPLFYGWLPTALVKADVDQATHESLKARPDLIAFPADLSQVIDLSIVKPALVSRDIPVGWLSSDLTYAQILRQIEALFIFSIKYHGFLAHRMIRSLWANDVALGDLPGFLIDDVRDTASFFGVSSAGITKSTTVEELAIALSSRMASKEQ